MKSRKGVQNNENKSLNNRYYLYYCRFGFLNISHAHGNQTGRYFLWAGQRRHLSGADIGISLTGIAGPGGGSQEKPVGLVYAGVSSPWHSEVKELHLGRGYDKERELIRWLASSHALSLIMRTAQMKP